MKTREENQIDSGILAFWCFAAVFAIAFFYVLIYAGLKVVNFLGGLL